MRDQTCSVQKTIIIAGRFGLHSATTVVLAIVASVLWWRLSHTGTASQPGATSASESMEAMAQTSSANASGSEPGAAGDPQAGNMQETPLAPIPAHAPADAEHRHCAWEG